MATEISSVDANVQSSQSQQERANSNSAKVESASVPRAGRAMSFEEAKAWALKKYDSALRELAK